MNSIYKKSEEQKDQINDPISKELVYSTIPELIDALGKNKLILEKSQVNVAVSFENGTINPLNRSIHVENASIAFTLTPFTK